MKRFCEGWVVLKMGLMAGAMVLGLAACSQPDQATDANAIADTRIAASSSVSQAQAVAMITGAGATFPYPLYTKWSQAYRAQNHVDVNYQAIGSGGGIKQMSARVVDFGATDQPLAPKVLEEKKWLQFPTMIGGIVPIVNLPGIKAGQLKLTGDILARIYLGEIKNWNDPAMVRLNPSLSTVKDPIVVVHRSDGSGTSFIFTHYLSDVSPQWAKQVGSNAGVSWPKGVGGKGNDGVANYVSRIKGAIGCVEYSYAEKSKLVYCVLQNREGHWVVPHPNAFQAAAKYASWDKAPGFYQLLTNQAGPDSWPIVGATFILMPIQPSDASHAQEVLKFFDWSYEHGDDIAREMGYVPLPGSVKNLIRLAWKKILGPDEKPIDLNTPTVTPR